MDKVLKGHVRNIPRITLFMLDPKYVTNFPREGREKIGDGKKKSTPTARFCFYESKFISKIQYD